MFDQSYLELLELVFKFDFKLLCPWKEGSGNTKFSKLFLSSLFSPLTLLLIMASFVYFERDTLSFVTVAENMALIITMIRSIGYAILVKKFFFDYVEKVEKLFNDRRTLPMDPSEHSMAERYCKFEFMLTLLYHLTCYLITFFISHVLAYFFPNTYFLLFNCYIIFLPPKGFLFAYELNYLVITVVATFTALPLTSYLTTPFVLMNHSSWLLDMALMTADDLNMVLQAEEDIRDPERVTKINENLKKFAQRCEKFVEWQSEIQNLLFWFFNLDFQIQSLILCLSIYVISFTSTAGLIFVLFAFCTLQIFVLCWMGERVTTRIDRLSFEISKNWYLMPTEQRKIVQMILHWTQNMKGFSGMFKDVSLETCKSIFEASYSFYAFLRSTNDN